jgi:predicted DNA-binding protein
MRRRKKVTWYYDLDQLDALDALSAETRVPKAVLVRLAIKQYLRFIDDQRSTTRLLAPIDEPEGKTLAEVFADEDE